MAALSAPMDPGVCPSCGRPLTKGYLVAESFVEGAKWMVNKTKLAVGGEVIFKPDGWGNVYMDAYRCNGCRRLFLQY